jgi:hypothetical protein
MATETMSAPTGQVAKRSFANSTFGRVARYSLVRLVTLLVTVIIGLSDHPDRQYGRLRGYDYAE